MIKRLAFGVLVVVLFLGVYAATWAGSRPPGCPLHPCPFCP